MKNLLGYISLPVAIAGCANVGMAPGNQQAASPQFETTSSPSAPTGVPRLVIPATGGAPVMAIPLGGDIYLPITGEPPVPGIPVSP